MDTPSDSTQHTQHDTSSPSEVHKVQEEHHLLSPQSPAGMQSLALNDSWSAGSYRVSLLPSSPPLSIFSLVTTRDYRHLCADVHACPSNEDLSQDIVQAPLGMACTPSYVGDNGDR